MINGYIVPFLQMTSQRMYQPHIGGVFHVFAVMITVTLAVFASVLVVRATCSRRARSVGSIERYGAGGQPGYKKRIRFLAAAGWLMALSEIYKQLFLYHIVNEGAFDWWFFPFQLCSVPMYMCILLPFVKENVQKILLTFMTGFTFISAVCALIYPEDMLRPYVSLTVHGFAWHGVLLMISIVAGASGMADLTLKGYIRSVFLFLGLSAAAVGINVIGERISAESILRSYPNMFYLSPYHMSDQPFVDIAEKSLGRLPAMGLYVLAIILLAGVTDFIFRIISRKAAY